MKNKPNTIQLIDGGGIFNHGFSGFMNDLTKTKRLNVGRDGCSYRVVSIIGPQSSGKSTLLNHLFQTNFKELDSLMRRGQTTQGIWLATCVDIDPFTLVMDLEGSDGKERGQDDTTFEKQSALFALAVSDIIMINMFSTSVGLEQGSNMTLMRIVFQVMMQLLKPRKTVLLFVMRDKLNTEKEVEILKETIRESICQVWNSISMPQDRKDTSLDEIFSVEFVALSHYKFLENKFKEEVEDLKQRYFEQELTGNRQGVVPISGFAHNAEQIWKSIKENKNLDLPKQVVMVATFRCEEIAQEKLSHLSIDKGWCKLQKDAKSRAVDGFGEKLRKILDAYLSKYDTDAAYFEETVRLTKRQQLESKALNLFYPAYQSVVGHLRAINIDKFKSDFDQALQRGEGFAVAAENCLSQCMSEFDKGCKDACVEPAIRDPSAISWDPIEVKEELTRDIYEHMRSQLGAQYEKQLSAALEEPVGLLLHDGGNDTWSKIRELLGRETAAKREHLSRDLSYLKIDKETTRKMLESLAPFGRSVVEKRAKDEAKKVVSHMKDKFLSSFNPSREWTEEDDIPTIEKDACSGPLELLSVMAALRLDDEPSNMDTENRISLALTDDGDIIFDLLPSSTWKGVPKANVLIKPDHCKSLWKQFKGEIAPFLAQAYVMQKNAAKLAAAEAKVVKMANLAAAEKNVADEARLDSETKAAVSKAAEQARVAAEEKATELARLVAEANAAEVARLTAKLDAAEKELMAAQTKAQILAAEAKAAEAAQVALEAQAQARAAELKAAEQEQLLTIKQAQLEAAEAARKAVPKFVRGVFKYFSRR